MWATESSWNQTNSTLSQTDPWCFLRGVYLHECDEQEEGVGSPPDLLIEEPGQKGENPILGGTVEENKERGEGDFTLCLHSGRWGPSQEVH